MALFQLFLCHGIELAWKTLWLEVIENGDTKEKQCI
jgi:hypothetical protein